MRAMFEIGTCKTRAITLIAVMAGTSPALRAQDALANDVIARRSEAFDRAFSTGDIEEVAKFFADDVVIISAGGSATSFEKVLDAHREMFESRPGITMRHRPESIELGPEGWGLAAERGTWVERWREDGDEVTLEGTYQTMWRLVEGRWLKSGQILIAIRCRGTYCSG